MVRNAPVLFLSVYNFLPPLVRFSAVSSQAKYLQLFVFIMLHRIMHFSCNLKVSFRFINIDTVSVGVVTKQKKAQLDLLRKDFYFDVTLRMLGFQQPHRFLCIVRYI